jgi:hypothetical protein
MPIHSMKSRFSHGEFRVLKQKAQNQEQHFWNQTNQAPWFNDHEHTPKWSQYVC